jgi:aminotransferase
MKIEPAKRIRRLPEQFFAQLMQRVGDYVAKGYDVINLGQGNPDQPTPAHIVKRLQSAAANPFNHRYSPFSGFPRLKEAIAAFYQKTYGVTLDPEKEVAILIGAKVGLVELSQVLLNHGDICLVPDPGYPDYWSGVALSGAEMKMMPLIEENGYLPDYDAIPYDIKEKAKLMFLNYPNNPTGAVASREFFRETVKLAERHRILVAHDLAYGAIGFDGQRPPSFLQTDGAKEVGVEFYTLSKTYNMAGWRVGFAVGHAEVIQLINLIQDHYHCSLFGAIQEAAIEALTGPQDTVEALCKTYERRRNVLFDGLASLGWRVTPSKGSFFAWLPVPTDMSSVAFADYLLDNAQIAVAAGTGFGRHGEGYIRVGLLQPEDRLKEAVERISRLPIFRG